MEAQATTARKAITVETTVNAPVSKVWETWNQPEHITKWCAANDDWHAPCATNDLRKDGRFTTRMEAKDGSFGFDFGGVYTAVEENRKIDYTMDDNRKVSISFTPQGDVTHVSETFDMEETNPEDMQRMGWQAILDNFRKYTEANG